MTTTEEKIEQCVEAMWKVADESPYTIFDTSEYAADPLPFVVCERGDIETSIAKLPTREAAEQVVLMLEARASLAALLPVLMEPSDGMNKAGRVPLMGGVLSEKIVWRAMLSHLVDAMNSEEG